MSFEFQDTDGKWKTYPNSFVNQDLKNLERFLASAKRVISLIELIDYPREIDTIAIRHDVDHSLKHALKFAEWEYKRNIRATYFLLHTAFYYQNKDYLYDSIKELYNYGHEVGLHLNGYASAESFVRGVEIILEEVEILNQAGFYFRGCAVHGGHKDHTDLELFSDHGFVPQDLGFEYEAYLLMRNLKDPPVNVISDNRGQLSKPLENVEGKQTVMTLHPCHWPF